LVKNALHVGAMTQRVLAKVLGTSKSRVNRWARMPSGFLVSLEDEALGAALDERFLGRWANDIRVAAAAYEQTQVRLPAAG